MPHFSSAKARGLAILFVRSPVLSLSLSLSLSESLSLSFVNMCVSLSVSVWDSYRKNAQREKVDRGKAKKQEFRRGRVGVWRCFFFFALPLVSLFFSSCPASVCLTGCCCLSLSFFVCQSSRHPSPRFSTLLLFLFVRQLSVLSFSSAL